MPSTEWENMFVTNKGVVTRVYKNSHKSIRKRQAIKMGQRHTQTFHKG